MPWKTGHPYLDTTQRAGLPPERSISMSEEQSTYSANPGKQLVRTVDGVDYQRIPVKTHLITNTDDMADVVVHYAKDRMPGGGHSFHLREGGGLHPEPGHPHGGHQAPEASRHPQPLCDQDPRRHRSGHPGDYGDGPAGVRHPAHPVRRLLQRHWQAVPPEGLVLHRGRAQGPGHRRPHRGHHPSL